MPTADELKAMMDPGAGVNVDPSKIHSPFGNVTKPEDNVKDTDDFAEEKDPKGKTIWISTPTFEDQYKRFPQTTRLVGPAVAVYDAANPEQLKELNALLSKQQPEDAPSIIVASRKENFHEGKWLMLLEYFRVEYKQLITTS
ncbi:MAG: hypothetical protein ACK5DE_01930 [Bacteroidota bacterium]|jgi:hypothetical protein